MSSYSMQLPPLKQRVQHIHFIGVGGVGMSGIAEVLLHEGYRISGSDPSNNAATTRLTQLGATVYHHHDADHIGEADVVVISSAIKTDNPECIAAKAKGLPIIPRAEMLAELMRFRYGIAVAGTHGKTTTTSLIASILAEAELEPTFVIGGLLNSAGTNATLGQGQYLVAEADESDGSFVCLNPILSVVTNIDRDHLEHYDNSFEKLQKTFLTFIKRLPFYGLAILCLDDPIVQRLLPKIHRSILTYGEHPEADFRLLDFQQKGMQSHFNLSIKGTESEAIQLNMPGKHNALNAVAAIAVAKECGVSTGCAARALAKFQGIGRRLQPYGDYQFSDKRTFAFYDDYGHHPKEVAVTIEALRAAFPERRIAMVFQPHRYSRTENVFSEFVAVLKQVDVLFLLPVYAAGEAVIIGAESHDLHAAIATQQNSDCHLVSEQSLIDALEQHLQNDDVLVTQGAGSVSKIVQSIMINSSRLTKHQSVSV